MTGVMTLYRSSVGKKALMAITGVIWIGYVVVHMWGNLKIYAGAAALNKYAEELRYLGEPILAEEQGLWVARAILLVAILTHIWAAASLWSQSNAGRPVGYKQLKPVQPAYTYAAYTMRWGGLLIAAFILLHIAHFTLGVVGYEAGEFAHPEAGQYFVYENVVRGFQQPVYSLFYIVAMLALGLHIYHGAWSMFQTIGWNHTRYSGLIRGGAFLIAGAVVVGNISIPVAVLTGMIS